MTDRELLELAAKAAGIEWIPASTEKGTELEPVFGLWLKLHCEPYEGQRRRWNPLTDDGDALRLAVKLCLEVTPAGNYTAVRRFNTNEWFTDEWGYDPYDPMAATRRAIVRAAAEIGKSM